MFRFTCLLLSVCCLLPAASCRRVDRASPSPDEPAAPATEADVITTASGIELARIPAGSFRMGSEGHEADEAPVHEVSLDGFLMDRTEVTQKHWAELAAGNEFLSSDPAHFKGPDMPVEMVRWDMAALWCNARSRAEGLQPCYDEDTGECNFDADGYRLPTEAEWEYACRAGSEADFSFGSDEAQLSDYAWYADNAAKKTHPVGQKKLNAWGLFDMHGNVAEWCNDRYAADYYQASPAANPRGPDEGEQYVLRGGAWNCSAAACRAARRVGDDPGVADACFARDAVGFRCVRKAPAENAQDSGGESPATETATPDSPPDGAQSPAPESQSLVEPRPRLPVALVYGDVYLQHDTGPSHPERPARLEAIVKRLKESGLYDELTLIRPRPAAIEWITAIHEPEYVQRVKTSCRREVGWLDSRDTPVSARSYDIALEAAGGVLAAVDAVMEGKVRSAFCAVRPPGHHALADRAMGFCLFNNVAIAARYVQKKHGVAKVLIVDWDVHHGNGTQAVFYDDPSVYYFSVHRSPFYPGTGSAAEKGEGDGLGFTLNVPLPAGSDDEDYQKVFDERLTPAALEFAPDFVLISAGFDAHENDPLGGMEVTSQQYGRLTRSVRQIADTCCKGRIVSVLEGGYDLDGLAESVEAHLRALAI